MEKMRLQFFAEDESVEPEVAEPETEAEEVDEVTETEEVEEPEEEPKQSAEENAMYAKIRRKAEEDALKKARAEMAASQARQAQMDAYCASICEGKVNPETGKPINTAAEYFEALAAQDRVNARNQMQQAGVDTAVLDRYIANSPMMQEAQLAIQENRNYQSERMFQEDIQAIIAFDPTMHSADDVVADPSYTACIDYVRAHGGRLSDAYKLVNFDRLAMVRSEAAKQSAINAAKSKGHLGTSTGVTGGDGLSDIPEDVISQWKEWFPDKSRKELRELYNKSISA